MNIFKIEGQWKYFNLEPKIKELKEFYKKNLNSKTLTLDFKNLEDIDSSGIVLIIRYIKLFEKNSTTVEIINISSIHNKMLELYKTNYVHKEKDKDTKENFFEKVGKEIYDSYDSFKGFLYFVGKLSVYLFYLISHPKKIRFKAIINQIEIAAIPILPIIALALFLVGFVTAYQGSDQLNKFGAAIIVIEMSTMSMFREIAPFIAAVIIAGRSASSYTAQIGTMRITEEISAMRTMGFDIDIFLIIPRVIALIIILPLIVFFADMASLVGEMIIVKYHLGISYSQFVDRIYEYVEIRHILLGILKAPLFGLLIAVIGCYRGLQVKSGTDIGKYTTKAVVDSIFWLIVVNAIISLLSIQLGF
ncbi:ABC transporter permease [Halarcobacter ebronensis]|uniref:ABC transporter permease n=1 Tax=Halarcobacter ebronensis TaxID=1462615 RepID=A0A4Q1ATH1_9BACT|nr:ABC transporter permease [Halarcobacter ebronensis]QKF81901.1 lipid asymmetry ABC transporter MlaABCDEF, permease component MlaE [Halarcobacter ebronensis]RXK04378.1 ABC transporter permease [Halarcobacter ebronensis]